MIHLLLLLLLTVQSYRGADDVYPKCCDSDSVLKKIKSTYNCTKNVDHRRTQIIANETNFIDKAEEGYCVDIDDEITLFRLNGSEITKEKELDVDFYPKCCPVNYFYNSTTHGCVKSKNEIEPFFAEKFVEVGLPECDIIEDLRLHGHKYLKRLNGSLHLSEHNKIYENGTFCVDRDENHLFIARICRNDYEVCSKVRCVHKCCHDGKSFINGSKCYDTFVYGMDFSSFSASMDNINDRFVVIHGYKTPIYSLTPDNFRFHLDVNGVFKMEEVDDTLGKINITRYYDPDEDSYCIEHAVKKTLNGFFFFRRFREEQINIKFLYTRIAMAISCVFLVLTILYYSITNEKRTVFGKTLISYCLASLMAFLLLSYLGFIHRPATKACAVFTFLLLYSTLATFTWMNVMCIDIYWTFGSSKSFSSRQYRSKELKRFILYSLYGWGSPLVLTIIPLIFYHVDVLPFILQVIVDEKKCFLHKGDGNYAQLFFSTIPLAILELCNLVLFIKTAAYCLEVKREISRLKDSQVLQGEKKQKFNNFRDRFGLLLKLFLIMGISFLFEVVSTFFDFRKNKTANIIEAVWDTFNSLQGFFIFVIFIVKKRIFKKFQQNVGLTRLRKFSLVSSAMTQTTSLATLSNKQ